MRLRFPGGEVLEHFEFSGEGQVPAGDVTGRAGGQIQGSETKTSAPQPGMTSIRRLPVSAWTRRSRRLMLGASAARAPRPSSRTLISRFSPSQSHCVRTLLTSGCSIMASTRPRTMALAAWATSPGRAFRERRLDEFGLDAAVAGEGPQVLPQAFKGLGDGLFHQVRCAVAEGPEPDKRLWR